MTKLPYVVSADIHLLLKRWAKQNDFILPPDIFFVNLREDFIKYMKNIFINFDFISEEEILAGLKKMVCQNDLPVISLDDTYFQSKIKFELARLVDENGNNKGLGHRANTNTLLKQIKELKALNIKRVAIVDDVIFSGHLMERVINILSKINIQVEFIYAGIGISEGIRRISSDKCLISCVRTYDNVIDEICERDFYPGVPLSGRLLATGNNIGLPYILPFGDPVTWASIPCEKALNFSKFCLQQTILLFEEIETHSYKNIYCSDLPRKIIGLQQPDVRYTALLREIL